MSTKVCDVVIIGSGVTGLMLARKLSNLGVRVLLIERNEQFASGPSTRNQGWLHRGTYHATSIGDRNAAAQVAKRCAYGYQQILEFAPESVEDIQVEAIALLRNELRLHETIERWTECNIPHKELPVSALKAKYPEFNSQNISHAFVVRDLSINVRILYRKLLFECERNACELLNGVHINSLDECNLNVTTCDGEQCYVNSKLFIYTVGYSVKDIFQIHHNMDLTVRFWKSHSLIVPKFSQSIAFFLDPGEAGMMNHGNYSMIHLNEDARLCEFPDYVPIDEDINNVKLALARLTNVAVGEVCVPVACIKTDVFQKDKPYRDLDINVIEPIPNHLCCFPGKMTEAPYLTDVVTKMVYERLDDVRISYRPIDRWICGWT